jgi:GNAT superfamily N-acetyltransferase
MHPTMTMAEVAKREEGRGARTIREVADEWRPFAGGAMGRGGPGAWFNSTQGAGLAGPVEDSDVRDMIAFFEDRCLEPRIEVCPFVHESLVRALADERFVVKRFEMLFYRAVSTDEVYAPPQPVPPGLVIEEVDRMDLRAIDEFARTSLSGFLPEGMEPTPDLMAAASRTATFHRSVAVRAMLDGRCVGAGGMDFHEDLAALGGVTVVPDMRRRGIQLAMMAWRLRHAAARGARGVTIGSLPGAPTERNAARMGFGVAYSRVVLVRPGEGLAPMEVG